MTTSVIDLFCGCGGLSLGAHMAGLKGSVGVDADTDLSSAFRYNFPRTKLVNADLFELKPSDLKKRYQLTRPTAVLGGPPCQGFSVIGRRNANDPRNRLLSVFFEYVAYFRPSFFLMENVPGLREPGNRNKLDAALELLPGRYKVLEPTILDAAEYGAATSRPRLTVIGYDPEYVDHFSISEIRAAKISKPINVRAAISDLPKLSRDPENYEWLRYPARKKVHEYAELLRNAPARGLGGRSIEHMRKRGFVSGCQPTRHSNEVIKRFSTVRPGEREPISKYSKLNWDRPAYVLRAGTGADKGSYQAARPIHPEQPRVITVREAARIQGFPDWFQFHSTKWHSHRMIGNSVSPLFAKAILAVIVARVGGARAILAAE